MSFNIIDILLPYKLLKYDFLNFELKFIPGKVHWLLPIDRSGHDTVAKMSMSEIYKRVVHYRS